MRTGTRAAPLDRRAFLRQAIGRRQVTTLACGSLYMRYVDALAVNDPAAFDRAVEREIGASDAVLLIEREWLAREDFALALSRILRQTVRRPTFR